MLCVCLHRTIASVSVITVLTTAILIWVKILEDDNNLTESFEGLRLGKTKKRTLSQLGFNVMIDEMFVTVLQEHRM